MTAWKDGVPSEWGYNRYGESPYYSVPKGWSILVEHDWAGDWEFAMVVVWRNDQTGELRAAADSGCSCPTPFGDLELEDAKLIGSPRLTSTAPIPALRISRRLFTAPCETGALQRERRAIQGGGPALQRPLHGSGRRALRARPRGPVGAGGGPDARRAEQQTGRASDRGTEAMIRAVLKATLGTDGA